MKRISKYIFSFFLLLPVLAFGQDSTRLFRSVTFTADVGAASVQFFDDTRKTYAFSTDLQLKQNYYLGILGGWQSIKKSNELFDYRSDGVFAKLGFKYDFLEKKDSDKNSIAFVSVRLAYAAFNQESSNIILRNTYWGEKTFELEKESLNSLWLELGGGIRADMFKNFMIGWNLHIRVMAKKPDFYLVEPYNIPGFGKGSESVVFGFEYCISYRIPFAE